MCYHSEETAETRRTKANADKTLHDLKKCAPSQVRLEMLVYFLCCFHSDNWRVEFRATNADSSETSKNEKIS